MRVVLDGPVIQASDALRAFPPTVAYADTNKLDLTAISQSLDNLHQSRLARGWEDTSSLTQSVTGFADHFPPQQGAELNTLSGQIRMQWSGTTSGGPSLSEMKRRGWATFAVTALTQAERTSLTITYLSQYRKALGDQHVRELVTAPQTANPLYLRLVLNELRVFGYYDELGERLRRYLEPATLRDLFGQFLSRLEKDYERERPGLVGDSLRLLSAARHGLREHELLDSRAASRD